MLARLMLFTGVLLCGNAAAADPFAGWIIKKPPGVHSAQWYCENHAPFVWTVALKGEELTVAKQSFEELDEVSFKSAQTLPQFSLGKYKDYPRRSVQVDDGYLVGYNMGEWGGAIYWFSADASSNYLVAEKQVEHFVRRGQEVFALEGLSHLGRSRGSFVRLHKQDGRWVAAQIAKLPRAPGPYVYDGPDHLLLVTQDQLLRLSLSGTVQQLHRAKSTYGRASSIVKGRDGTLYIGAGAAVIALRPTGNGYQERWLVRPEDAKACRCRLLPHGVVSCLP